MKVGSVVHPVEEGWELNEEGKEGCEKARIK
jgi:hypothetical protein